MPWNGIGTFILNTAYSPEVNGTVIDANRYNGLLTDVASGITAALNKNGENAPTTNLSMGGFKHVNAAPGVASGQYATWEQVVGLGVAVGIIPQNVVPGTYTLVAGDAGKHLYFNTPAITPAFTIPANSSVPFAIGTVITFVLGNSATASASIACGDTLRLAGTTTTGTRTLAANGVATAIKVNTTEWYISGTGLS